MLCNICTPSLTCKQDFGGAAKCHYSIYYSLPHKALATNFLPVLPFKNLIIKLALITLHLFNMTLYTRLPTNSPITLFS